MSVIQTISRLIGANDIFWGVGSFSYQDVNGVVQTQPKVNAGVIPTMGGTTVDSALHDWILLRGSTDTDLQNGITGIGSDEVILRLARGTWVIDADVTVPSNICLSCERGTLLQVANGVTLTVNGGFCTDAPYQCISCVGTGAVQFGTRTPVIYADWFGADPLGVADSTAALTSAAASVSSDGGEILLSPGTYNITGGWTVSKANTKVSGSNCSSKLHLTVGSTSIFTVTMAASGVTLDGIDIDGFNTVAPTYGGCVKITGPKATVKNCYLHDGVYGIMTDTDGLVDIKTIRIRDNRFYNLFSQGVYLQKATNNTSPIDVDAVIEGNTIIDAYTAISLRSVKNVRIVDNYFKGMTGNCINEADYGEECENIIIARNEYAYDSTQPRLVGPATVASHFIECQGMNGLMLLDNTVDGPRRSNTDLISITGGAGVIGTGNLGSTTFTVNKVPAGLTVGSRVSISTSAGAFYATVLDITGLVLTLDTALTVSVAAPYGGTLWPGKNRQVTLRGNKMVLRKDISFPVGGPSFGGVALRMSYTKEFVVSDNTVTYNTPISDPLMESDGGIIITQSMNGEVHNNTINGRNVAYASDTTKWLYAGIQLTTYCTDVYVHDNLIKNLKSDGALQYLYLSTDNCFYYNNSFGTENNVGPQAVVGTYHNMFNRMENGKHVMSGNASKPTTGNWNNGDEWWQRIDGTILPWATYTCVSTSGGTAGTLNGGLTTGAMDTVITPTVITNLNSLVGITVGCYLTVAGAGAVGADLTQCKVLSIDYTAMTVTTDQTCLTDVGPVAAISYTAPAWARARTCGVTGAIATGTTVNHNLLSTPKAVLLQTTDGTACYATALGDTTFTVNFAGGGNKTFYWEAMYDTN